jgi:hypothetical protein
MWGGTRSSLQGTVMDQVVWGGQEEEKTATRCHRPAAREQMAVTDWVGLGTGHAEVAAKMKLMEDEEGARRERKVLAAAVSWNAKEAEMRARERERGARSKLFKMGTHFFVGVVGLGATYR